MQAITIVLDFLFFITAGLIFSITILCVLLYRRVYDQYLRGFLGVLFPLMIQSGLNMVNTYLLRIGFIELTIQPIYQSFALFATFISIFCSAAVLMSLSLFLTTLIPLSEKRKLFSRRIIYFISLAYLLACLYAIFFINRGDWVSALNLVLEDFFVSGSLLLAAHGITSLFYIKNAENREHENLLRGIAVTFIPLIFFFILDMLFLKGMSFKLTYLSYAIFCVFIYLFISRNYIRKYEPETKNLLTTSAPNLEELGFSKREIEIIKLVVEGKTNKEIGELLFISINTVKTHVKNIFAKLKVTNRIQLLHKVTNP